MCFIPDGAADLYPLTLLVPGCYGLFVILMRHVTMLKGAMRGTPIRRRPAASVDFTAY